MTPLKLSRKASVLYSAAAWNIGRRSDNRRRLMLTIAELRTLLLAILGQPGTGAAKRSR